MTSTPADPIAAEAREIERIVAEVAARFLTFGIGGYKVMNTPISEWLAEKPPQFALGVSVEEVVRFVIERMKSAGRAEASAWRPMREARDAMLDAIRVLDRERACVIDNNAEDRDEEGDPIASSITDADALHEIAEYTSIIERLKSALPPAPEGGETK